MKSIIIILLLAFTVEAQATEKPASTISQLREIKPRGWYEQQHADWSAYLEKAAMQSTAADWLEYFQSAKLAGKHAEVLKEIAASISSRFEGSFEDHYAQYHIHGWNTQGIASLRSALAQQPSGAQLADRIMLAEFDRDEDSKRSLASSLFDSGIIYPSLLNYSYNVLMSVAEGGVLFVQGLPTTIPLWILQSEMNIRSDVKVLNLDLAENGKYLSLWAAEHGMLLASKQSSPLVGLPASNPELSFFYGLTLRGSDMLDFESQLYVVGLASFRNEGSFDHYGTLRTNIENRFLLDYLSIDFQGEPKTSTGKVYESNYILPFLLLKEYYDEVEDEASAEAWEGKILQLAEHSQIKNRVAMLMEQRKSSTPPDFTKIAIDIKELDKNLLPVRDNLYASRYELTNREYWYYLNYLSTNGYEELFEMSRADLSKYDELTATFLTNYHYSPANYSTFVENKPKRGGGDYLDYPAVDMSFEAAQAYCEWLTVQYNQQEGRQFKKVLFRLPTQKEWSVSALGSKSFKSWNVDEINVQAWGEESWSEKGGTKKNKNDLKTFNVGESNILYPWWYPNMMLASTMMNRFGCYLANVKTTDEIICSGRTKGDGWTLMAPVGSYFPNQMELYDMVGNVAEMSSTEGRAMGGSWNHLPEESTIKSVNNYEGSDISVGFRLFMEVIEQ